jgi:hypothetical protein
MIRCIFSTTLTIVLLLLISCKGEKKADKVQPAGFQTGPQQVANQIIYDVVIKNPDPEDQWTEQCLAGMKQRELVDFIFSGLYDERFRAFDIFNNKAIPASRIRKMEEDGAFKRDQISKIQFVEDWYVDPENYSMTKRVREVRLGIEHFDGFGMHLGHNPLFKVRLIQE